MNFSRLVIVGVSTWLMVTGLLTGQAVSLERGFQRPPREAYPWVYWFWLNGNITREGIRADLEAMKAVGISGVLIMEVDQGAPAGPVDFASPRWRDMFQFVVAEARRLGLEVNMNNDAGWNGSGGPWIRPEQSMQKVVWSETNVAGPCRFEGVLPQPETVAGFYKDITWIAFPKPGSYRIDRIRAKAAYEVSHVGPYLPTNLPPDQVIARSRLQDLSRHSEASGRIDWEVPAGEWTIMRIGHTSTGVENAPAPKSGRGLECDKLSREGVESNFAGLMAKLATDNGSRPGRRNQGLVATHIDSWENGSQNWTARMREEFNSRRGYDLFSFLPVLSGRVVESQELSERFLWDLRRTISELVIENYAGRMRELAHAHGLRFTAEAYGSPCDVIPYAGQSDEPMGEFWTPSAGAMETCRAMASAGHAYGKRIIGAEAFTAGDHERWREHPAVLKALGDQAFCEGINRFVFHRYALQPWAEERMPGMTMGPWGQHYERTQTWWRQSADWHTYLARCQYMLRQGRYAADICYLQPEAPPAGPGSHNRGGYAWDDCSSEVVLTRLRAEQGTVVLPDGVRYRVLVLPNTRDMTPHLLRKIRDLVAEGATVLGNPPQKSPSLAGYPACDAEVAALARELWGENYKAGRERRFGKGVIVPGVEPEKYLQDHGVPPAFSNNRKLRFIQRTDGETQIFFVASPWAGRLETVASFRVTGKQPEFWWPDTGKREIAPLYSLSKGTTSVNLPLGPRGSVFVVFRKDISARDAVLAVARNGTKVQSSIPDPHQQVQVVRASYGIPGDGQRSRDVRDEIQGRLDAGEDTFAVRSLAANGDPAFGMAKTLSVDFQVDGKLYSVKGADSDTVQITSQVRNVKVLKATYGVLSDPNRTRDVREKAQRIFDNGSASFQVAQMAQGDDPAYLVVKTLVLDYEVDGQKFTYTGTDPETMDLTVSPAAAERLIQVATDGSKPVLRAWADGHYRVSTARGKSWEVTVAGIPAPQEIRSPWSLRFEGVGAPEPITVSRLESLSDHANAMVKHFSGTTIYATTFELPPTNLSKGRRVLLDLGRVEVMASVRVNERQAGNVWKTPYELDITDVIKRGVNVLEIRVVNLWPNRMIGDEFLPEDSERNPNGTLKSWPAWLQQGKPSPTGRFTFTSWRLWEKKDPLLPSGLIGPVRLVWSQDARPVASK